MESLTKPVVRREDVARAAKAAVGDIPVGVKELTDGWFGAAFDLTFDRRKNLVLKVAPAPGATLLRYEANLMAAEVAASRLVREKTTLPVPEIVFYDDRRTVTPFQYFLVEKLRGAPLNQVKDSVAPEVLAAVYAQVARHLREMHDAIPAPAFGLFGGPTYPTWRRAYEAWMDDLRQDAADFGVDGLDEAFAIAAQLAPALDGVTQGSLIHWDLWDGNIFIDPATGEITGYIDFERARWADPLMEHNFLHASPEFWAQYGAPSEADMAPVRVMLYRLQLHLILVIESYSRGFDAGHLTWARQELVNVTQAANDLASR